MIPVAELHIAMAGRGNPYSVLTPLRKELLRATHELYPDATRSQLQQRFQHDQLETELTPLLEASLLQKTNDVYTPCFFIADAEETSRTNAHAQMTGRHLAHQVIRDWVTLRAAIESLKLKPWTFDDLAFFLIGNRVLDNGLLNALARDGTLLGSAPARPSPDFPGAHYCFWMVEGEADALGAYGQRYTVLPWDHWMLLTYGRYRRSGVVISERVEMERRTKNLADTAASAKALGRTASLPVFNRRAVTAWETQIAPLTDDLVQIYRSSQSAIRDLFKSFRASEYAPESFTDFFCWYDHLSYAHAIDALSAAGLLHVPARGFTAAIWYEVPRFASF
jgi:hypothetical protein